MKKIFRYDVNKNFIGIIFSKLIILSHIKSIEVRVRARGVGLRHGPAKNQVCFDTLYKRRTEHLAPVEVSWKSFPKLAGFLDLPFKPT